MDQRNVALCGFMAAGKTTVGRALAARLGFDFVDSDEALVAAAGRPIPAIFAAEGEAGFRARERDVVAALARRSRTVIALGGGVVNDERNVAGLRAGGTIVLLRISPAEAARRILADGVGRPMIDQQVAERTPEAVEARVRELLATREPAYRAAADVTIEVDGRSVDELTAAIVAALER